MIALCCNESRRVEISQHPVVMGLDYIEVSSDQTRLELYFIPASPGNAKQFVPPGLTTDNIVISGGERITGIKPIALTYVEDHIVVVVSDGRPAGQGIGDFSSYQLQLVDVPHLDPTASDVSFSFKVQCPSEFDCSASPTSTPLGDRRSPQLNYLAKDYASFRQLMLDRLSTLMPQWSDRNAADLGMTLVELLAYVADHLSYQQDAIATEAYLGTARKRISVKRHARLVDYVMHDGQNARVWVLLVVNEDGVEVKAGTQVVSRVENYTTVIPPKRATSDRLMESRRPVVFQLCHDATLYQDHAAMPFYDWHNQRCQLPQGATSATLLGHFPNLRAGQVLVLEQTKDPLTQLDSDADPRLRHPVLLTEVIALDDVNSPLVDELTTAAITLIRWSPDDALPWPLCISVPSKTDGQSLSVAVAHGNVVLADHGRTISEPENLKAGTDEEVPAATMLVRDPRDAAADCCDNDAAFGIDNETIMLVATRFRPQLAQGPLTFAVPLKSMADWTAARHVMTINPQQALPMIRLAASEVREQRDWSPVRDLLSAGPDDRQFVVEVETQGATQLRDQELRAASASKTILRFGDGEHGRRPMAGTRFQAIYRIGNGAQGNIGAESLGHVISDDPRITSVRNPLPAVGGVDPESIESARLLAPTSFRRQERAVTADDYAEIAMRHPDVQRAAATFRWTGSWITVFLTIDRRGGRAIDSAFASEMLEFFDAFRMAGVDLHIDSPRFVPLDIELHVCVRPNYLREHIQQRLREVLSNRTNVHGEHGFFHPDNFSFGTPVFASQLISKVRALTGVENVVLQKLQRLMEPNVTGIDSGQLLMDRLEIARLDNDPNFPENGRLRVDVGGGR